MDTDTNNPQNEEFEPDSGLNKLKDKPRKKRRTNIFLIILLLLAPLIFFVAILFALRFHKDVIVKNIKPAKQLLDIDTAINNPGQVAFANKDHILILCLGLDENRDDRGIGHTKGSRTDTIFILSMDKEAQKLGMLSVPRDTWIEIGNEGHDKINSAYSYGYWAEYDKSHNYEKAKLAGIESAKKTIGEFLGVNIDYYMLLKIDACKEMVDSIGGIPINVEKDMDYDDNWGKLHVHLKKGYQRLNGQQAVGYARFRHDEESDWGRIRRQQQVMQALIAELKKPVHIMHISRIASVIKGNLDTDMSLAQLIDIACVYKNFNRDNTIKGVITGTDDVTAGGAMIIVPDDHEKRRLVNRILRVSPETLTSEMSVRVLNGSYKEGLAKKVAAILEEQGFKITEIGDADRYDYMTRIVDHRGDQKGLALIDKCLGGRYFPVFDDFTGENKNADFTVIIGNDYEQSANGGPISAPTSIDVQSTEGFFTSTGQTTTEADTIGK